MHRFRSRAAVVDEVDPEAEPARPAATPPMMQAVLNMHTCHDNDKDKVMV